MNLGELKKVVWRTCAELHRKLNIEGASAKRKQDLIFEILEARHTVMVRFIDQEF